MSRQGDSRPIGVFDSGVGGLTVLTELQRRLPDERFIYLGDNARTPYGSRDGDEVRRFTIECIRWLLGRDIKLLLLACNTATAQALDLVRETAAVPVLGVIRPGAVAVAAATRRGHVGVIATAGTVGSDAYARAISEANPRIAVRQLACPELVPIVERGELDGPRTRQVVAGYLDALMAADEGIDTLLLGCTHYPLLRPLIEARLGSGVAVVDSAFTTAVAVEDLLDALGMRAAPGGGGVRVATTGSVDAFRAVAARLFGDALPPIEAVDVAEHSAAVTAARG